MILVTGGSGFVGRHLVKALLEDGNTVRVLTRNPGAIAAARQLSAVAGDLADTASLDRAMRGIHVVVHLAGILGTSTADEERLFDVNVRGGERTALAARKAGVTRFINVSSGGVYGDGHTPTPHRETDAPRPVTAYERSKLGGEAAIDRVLGDSVVELMTLRPAGVFGAGRAATLAFFQEVRRRPFWLHGSPNVIVHPTHVSDVVQACMSSLRLARWTEPVINIAGQRPVRFHEFVDLAAEALGVRVRQFVVPSWAGRPIGRAVTRTLSTARMRVPPSIELAGRGYANRALNTTLAERVLRFEPIPLERALRETVRASGRQGGVNAAR